MSTASPERIPTAPYGKDPIFSPDGRFLYMLTQTPQDHLQAPPEMKKTPQKVSVPGAGGRKVGGQAAAVRSVTARGPFRAGPPAGKTGVFVQEQKNAYGSSWLAITWLDLPSGRVRKQHRIPAGYASRFRGVVDENGMMVFTPYYHLLVAMDLESGRKGLLLSAPVLNGQVRLGGTRFLGDGRVPVLRAIRKPEASTEVWLASPLHALNSRPASDMPPFCRSYGEKGKEKDGPKKSPEADAASSASDESLSGVDVYTPARGPRCQSYPGTLLPPRKKNVLAQEASPSTSNPPRPAKTSSSWSHGRGRRLRWKRSFASPPSSSGLSPYPRTGTETFWSSLTGPRCSPSTCWIENVG